MEKFNVGQATRCTKCKKMVTILEVVTEGLRVIYAPCEVCSTQNVISSEKLENRERGPAEVDLLNQSEVVRYMRDLINLSSLLENGADPLIELFMDKLKEAGYSYKERQRLLTYAATNTRYDHMTDEGGRNLVPRVIPNGAGY
ncbi:MAG: hypothetical protein IMZ47_05980 [Firmicutes bacterium]|nr:hypothetical protein [Bacillota bacterium]